MYWRNRRFGEAKCGLSKNFSSRNPEHSKLFFLGIKLVKKCNEIEDSPIPLKK